MKTAVYVAVLLVLAFGAGMGLRSQVHAGGAPNRYVVVSGTYLLTGGARNGGDVTTPAVFRMDTATGQTWEFVNQFYEGKLTRVWMPIPEK